MKNILVTGAFGQIGSELVPALLKKKGVAKVVAHDKRQPPAGMPGIIQLADITDAVAMERIVKKYKIDTIFHLVSLLSATGEQNPNLAWDINMNGLKIILDLAVKYKLRVFWPSSIAAFGPTTPRNMTPQKTVLEPTTMYGVTKVAGELLCQYYHLKYGVDIRSVRYPGLISWKTHPGGGTTDYAVAMFHRAIADGAYECFVKKDTILPMMYMDDAIAGTIKLMDAPAKKITVRTSYNLAAISFRADELVAEINKFAPLTATYKPDHRQKIADSWPRTINDSQARKDWGWKHKFDLTKMTKVMLLSLSKGSVRTSGGGILIREFTQSDIKNIVALQDKALKTEPKAFPARYQRIVELFVVAEKNNQLVGMVGAYQKPKGAWNLMSMYAIPELRGQGIAENLINEIIAKIQAKPGARSINLTVSATSKPAVTLYQKLGFKIAKTSSGKHLMVKFLLS